MDAEGTHGGLRLAVDESPMTRPLQIADVAAVLIAGGLSALVLAARSLHRRFPGAGLPSDRE